MHINKYIVLSHTPWTKVGSDFLKLNWQEYVQVTYYTTKYAVVRRLPERIPASAVILMHQRVFKELGVAPEIVSDQGPYYKLEAFETFCEARGKAYTFSSPNYAQSNGEVD